MTFRLDVHITTFTNFDSVLNKTHIKIHRLCILNVYVCMCVCVLVIIIVHMKAIFNFWNQGLRANMKTNAAVITKYGLKECHPKQTPNWRLWKGFCVQNGQHTNYFPCNENCFIALVKDYHMWVDYYKLRQECTSTTHSGVRPIKND